MPTPDVLDVPDGQMNMGNAFRIFHNGRIYDLYHTPLGPWAVWYKTVRLGQYSNKEHALYAIEHNKFD